MRSNPSISDEMRVLWDDLNWLEKEDHPMKKSQYTPEQMAFGRTKRKTAPQCPRSAARWASATMARRETGSNRLDYGSLSFFQNKQRIFIIVLYIVIALLFLFTETTKGKIDQPKY
jgi:hypothetical protein